MPLKEVFTEDLIFELEVKIERKFPCGVWEREEMPSKGKHIPRYRGNDVMSCLGLWLGEKPVKLQVAEVFSR